MKKLMIVWIFLALGLVGTLTFIGLQFQEDIKPYRSFESDLVESAQVYMDLNKPLLDVGESLKLDIAKLIEDKLINTNEVGEDICNGYVIVKKTYEGLEYEPFIQCEEYKTNRE